MQSRVLEVAHIKTQTARSDLGEITMEALQDAVLKSALVVRCMKKVAFRSTWT